MQDVLKRRQHQLVPLRSSLRAKDRDEELALFLEMRNREKESNNALLRIAVELDGAALGISNFFFFYVVLLILA